MISLIAAVAPHNIIGAKNKLPWYLPEDLKRFKQVTTGHVVLMGRKTFESILGYLHKPLPNRTNVVITSHPESIDRTDVEIYSTIEDALLKHPNEDIFIIGGESVFKQMIESADKLYITEVHTEYEGDVYFPEIKSSDWKETFRENHEGFSFVEYSRIIK